MSEVKVDGSAGEASAAGDGVSVSGVGGGTGSACMCELSVYWEAQIASLCATHCLNNLYQTDAMFSEWAMAEMASDLRETERVLQAEAGVDSSSYLSFLAADSAHVDESGNFSVEVIMRCLHALNAQIIPYNAHHPQATQAHTHPHLHPGYICNLQNHWFSLRRFDLPACIAQRMHALAPHQAPVYISQPHHAPHDATSASAHVPAASADAQAELHSSVAASLWLNLNSLLDHPELISASYLAIYLAQLQREGYSIFIVDAALPTNITHHQAHARTDIQADHTAAASSPSAVGAAQGAGGGKYYPLSELFRLKEQPAAPSHITRHRQQGTRSTPAAMDRGRQEMILSESDDEQHDEGLMQAIRASLADHPAPAPATTHHPPVSPAAPSAASPLSAFTAATAARHRSLLASMHDDDDEEEEEEDERQLQIALRLSMADTNPHTRTP